MQLGAALVPKYPFSTSMTGTHLFTEDAKGSQDTPSKNPAVYTEPSIPAEEFEKMQTQNKQVSELVNLRKYEEALKICMQHSTLVKKYYGEQHPATYSSLNNLALIMKQTGNLKEAQELYERIVKGYEQLFGKKHISTIIVMQNLANLYKVQKLYKQSEKLFLEVIALRKGH